MNEVMMFFGISTYYIEHSLHFIFVTGDEGNIVCTSWRSYIYTNQSEHLGVIRADKKETKDNIETNIQTARRTKYALISA
jgi:hypothetical protein